MNKYPFSCYSFIRKENDNWISLGIIKDDKQKDTSRFDYTLPSSSLWDRFKAEALAISLLADTSRFVLPVEARERLLVIWKISCQQTLDFINKNPDIITKFENASPFWELQLMSPREQAIFEKELNANY